MRPFICVIIAGCLACGERVQTSRGKELDSSQHTASIAPDTSADEDSDSSFMAQIRRDHAATLADARAAIGRTGLDSALAFPLLLRLAQGDSIWNSLKSRPATNDTALAGVLERWFAAAAALPSDRRADAYYAADLFLGLAGFGLDRTPAADSARQR